MISVGNNKAVICKGDFHPAQLYKGDKKIAGYTVESFESENGVVLENCYNDKVYDLQITENVQSVTVRGKNYFDLDKVPFNTTTTQAYKNGIMAKKVGTTNRGKNTPISIPSGKTIKVSLDVVDSYIAGTSNLVVLGIRNDTDEFSNIRIPSKIGHVERSITLSQDCTYIQFYFMYAETQNAPGDYVTMDNIMIRVEGDDAFEHYVEPETIPFENGELTADIPTFKGTTVIEVDSDVETTISGKYKKVEV